MTDDSNLERLEPSEAKEMYLDARTDIAESTRKSHAKRIEWFVDWCESQEIENLNDLGGRDIRRYRIDTFDSKKDGSDYSDETVRGYLDTLRVFLQLCAEIDGVRPAVPEKVTSPRPGKSRNEELDAEHAAEVLENLKQYEHASLRHVLLTLMWRIGLRVGTLRGLDVDDVDTDAGQLIVTHQPRSDTPLKNQWDAERSVAISDETADLLEDYIETNRTEATDDDGRRPLFSSRYGRRHTSNLRETIYTVTRACEFGGECPHDRNPDSCDAARRTEEASKCPSTVSPHPVRRGAISHMLRSGVPKAVVSDRADVSPDVLDEHYSTLSESEKAERRRDYLDDAFDDY